ncbi:MAG: hypothetical protein U0236_23775, partial [Nitrospira sp.]
LETTPLKLPTPMADRDRQLLLPRFESGAGSAGRRPGHFCLTLHVAMQLGLYLPGPFTDPVWRAVSEDSE